MEESVHAQLLARLDAIPTARLEEAASAETQPRWIELPSMAPDWAADYAARRRIRPVAG